MASEDNPNSQTAGNSDQARSQAGPPNGTERRKRSDRRETVVDRRGGLDRRRRRTDERSGRERRKTDQHPAVPDMYERRGPGIRRSEDRRAAEEGEMTNEQWEFLRTIEAYKQANNKPFPTWTEVLEVVKKLGYRKVDPSDYDR